MIRCIRIWTDNDGSSRFEEGVMELPHGTPFDATGEAFKTASISFRETMPEQALPWHTAPAPQLVLTLSGALEFEMRDGQSFIIRTGDVLLAEDTTGSGHRWRLIGAGPWRRAYVILPDGLRAGFTANA